MCDSPTQKPEELDFQKPSGKGKRDKTGRLEVRYGRREALFSLTAERGAVLRHQPAGF